MQEGNISIIGNKKKTQDNPNLVMFINQAFRLRQQADISETEKKSLDCSSVPSSSILLDLIIVFFFDCHF